MITVMCKINHRKPLGMHTHTDSHSYMHTHTQSHIQLHTRCHASIMGTGECNIETTLQYTCMCNKECKVAMYVSNYSPTSINITHTRTNVPTAISLPRIHMHGIKRSPQARILALLYLVSFLSEI